MKSYVTLTKAYLAINGAARRFCVQSPVLAPTYWCVGQWRLLSPPAAPHAPHVTRQPDEQLNRSLEAFHCP